MHTRSLAILLCVMAIAAGVAAPAPAPAATSAAAATTDRLAVVAPRAACESLSSADLSAATGAATTILEATTIPATADAAGYCRIRGRIAPQIRFEVRLPTGNWTQRYVQLGCGGLCGNLSVRLDDHASLCAPAAAGSLALASTDMGHEGGNDGSWAAGNPQAMIDFAYRGVHLTAVAAKALIRVYYGQPAKYAYFNGCSDGGREGLMEAQRYPDDFDGIAAGAPALNFTVQNSFYHAWNALANTAPDGRAILTAARLPVLHAAAVAACDARDGVTDGLLSDPMRCDFDPHTAQCTAGQATDACLTAEEADVAAKIYAAAHDSAGRKLVAGGPMRGSELSWAGVFVPANASTPIFSGVIADGSVRNLYFPAALPASWRLNDLTFDAATLESFQYRSIYDATNPDLSAFSRRGGRLIVWHGWSDPHISPVNSIEYYNAMRRQMGVAGVQQFARLYLVPGLYHCNGGDGYARFDVLTPLMDWVEARRAPAALRTVRAASPATGSRDAVLQLEPYGQATGPASAAAPPALDWLGARYMTPATQQSCAVADGRMRCVPVH